MSAKKKSRYPLKVVEKWFAPPPEIRAAIAGAAAAERWLELEPMAEKAAGDVFKLTKYDPRKDLNQSLAAYNVIRLACIKAFLAGAAVSQSARKQGGKNGGEKRRKYDPGAMRKYHARKVASGLSWTAAIKATVAHYGCSSRTVHDVVGRKPSA